jgi:hypothetical protein
MIPNMTTTYLSLGILFALGGGKLAAQYDATALRPRCDRAATALRPRCDRAATALRPR